jgi:hypothetical protein
VQDILSLATQYKTLTSGVENLTGVQKMIEKHAGNVLLFQGGKTGWVERTTEKNQIQEALSKLKKPDANNPGPLVVIDGFDTKTDQIILDLVKTKFPYCELLILSTVQDLQNLKMPENIKDLKNLFVFNSRHERTQKLKEWQTPYQIKAFEWPR